jgi:hypothetical protein
MPQLYLGSPEADVWQELCMLSHDPRPEERDPDTKVPFLLE